jgi:hypothetical protein
MSTTPVTPAPQLTIPGFPANVIPLAYRVAATGEHWFEPFENGLPGVIHPGPSMGVVLVVGAAPGHFLVYDINSDTTIVSKDEPVDSAAVPDTSTPPLRANQLLTFSEVSKRLISGTVKRAARATWAPSRYITFVPEHAPHFTTERGLVWAYKSIDLNARDWVAVPVAPKVTQPIEKNTNTGADSSTSSAATPAATV